MGLLSWLRPARRGRGIRDSYRVPAASVREGALAKVVGRVRTVGPLLTAPITGRRCVCWQVDVGAPVVHVEESARDFLVEDESGTALVRVASVRLVLVKDLQTTAGVGGAASALAARAGFTRRERAAVRVREGVLAAGDEVAVYAVGRWEPDPDGAASGATYRDAPKRLVLVAPPRGKVDCSNDPFALT